MLRYSQGSMNTLNDISFFERIAQMQNSHFRRSFEQASLRWICRLFGLHVGSNSAGISIPCQTFLVVLVLVVFTGMSFFF